MIVTRLRVVFAGSLGALVAVSAAAGAGTPGRSVSGAISNNAALGRSIVVEINAVRASRGLRRLTVSRPLAMAAERHSRDMAHVGYFAHESRDGSPFDKRVRRYYGSSGFRSWRAGENLLWASPEIDAKRAVEMWLGSSSHRRILLTAAWREIGLSAVHTASGPRVFDGRETTVVTADFGVRVR
jgi:uncharacterized protein YkwD